MAAPDPAVVERQMYVDMHLNGVDDPTLTLADLRDLGGGGVNANKAAKAAVSTSLETGNGSSKQVLKADSIMIPVPGMVDGGVTDNSSILQTYLDKGNSFTKRRVVFLPAGTFKINTAIDLNYPVRIVGAGKGNTIIIIGSSAFKALSDNVTIEGVTFRATIDRWFLVTQTSGASFKGWVIRDCEFDHIGLNLTASGRDLGDGTTEVTATRVAYRPVVERCEFYNYLGNETIYVAGTIGAVLDKNHVHDCGTDTNSGEGIKVLSFATGTVVSNNLIERTKRDGIDAYNSIASTLINNVIRDPGVNGIEAKWSSDNVNIPREMIIMGNRVERAGATAYQIDSPKVTAIGNYALQAAGSGFRFFSATDNNAIGTDSGAFIGNVAIGCQDGFGFGVNAVNLVILGNIAKDNINYGFNLAGAHSMIGNTASNNGAGNFTSVASRANMRTFLGNLGSGSNGEMRLPNDQPITMHTAAGTAFDLIKLSSLDVFLLGSNSAGAPVLRLQSSSTNYIEMIGRLLPGVTNTYDSGSSTKKWKDIYLAGVLKLGTTTTASRPTAASAGAGGVMYDTTLSKPIYSDGTTWRDAMGTAV